MTDSPGAFTSTLTRETGFPQDGWRERLGTNAWIAAFDGRGDAVGLACGLGDGPTRMLAATWVASYRRSGFTPTGIAHPHPDPAKVGVTEVEMARDLP